MRRQFNDLESFAAHLRVVRAALPRAIQLELAVLGEAVVKDAKAKFGIYQPGWPQLAEDTQEARVKQGYSPDDPLLRTGALRDLVTSKVHFRGIFVGVQVGTLLTEGTHSVDAATVMGAQEFGTDDHRIPPRPVFGPLVKDARKYAEGLVFRSLKRAGL